jgi:MFS family permease
MRFDNINKLILMNFFNYLFFYAPVLVFLYMSRGLNLFQIISLEAWLIASVTLLEIPTGVIADKFGRKISIVLANVCYVISMAIYIYAYNYWAFVISFIIYGTAVALSSGSMEAMIYDTLKERKQHKLITKVMGSLLAVQLLAVAIANVIGSYIGRDLTPESFSILIILVIAGQVMGLIIALTLNKAGESKVKEKSLDLFKEGIKLIRKNKSLLRIILLGVFTTPFINSIVYLYQPYLKQIGTPVVWFGTIYATAMIVGAILSKYVYKIEKKFGMKTAIFILTILPGLFYLSMSQTWFISGAIFLFVSNQSVMVLSQTLFSKYRNEHIPSRNRATVLSTISFITAIYLIFMRLLIGYLAEISLVYAFILMGTVITIGAILLRINESHLMQEA